MKMIAIIADIVKSKNIHKREEFQKKLDSVLMSLNNTSDGVVSPYTITLGDEFQAVYDKPDTIIEDIMHILYRIYPVKIRFSIGINELATELNKKSAIGMDGPVFHIAREGIELLKEYDTSIIQIYDGTKEQYDFINKSLMLNFLMMDGWKENTMKIYGKLVDGKKVKEIKDEVDISQRAIYKTITTNKLAVFVEYFKSLEKEIMVKFKE